MSCNHVYSAEERPLPAAPAAAQRRPQRARVAIEAMEQQQQRDCDELLDRAATWGSGGPLLAVVLTLWSMVMTESSGKDSQVSESEEDVSSRSTERGVTVEDLEAILDGVSEWGSGEPILGALIQAWNQVSKSSTETEDQYKPQQSGGIDESDCEQDKDTVQEWNTEQLLDGAANYCSGESLWTVVKLLPCVQQCTRPRQKLLPRNHRKREATILQYPYSALTHDLPTDVQVNVLSFLHPHDVITVASVNRACISLIDKYQPTAEAIWKTLWERDYAWLVHEWPVGKQARCRSVSESTPYSKAFYFEFGLTYLNYVLAGQNSPEQALVGLHGNIYDITNFLDEHPGSPETLLVESGRDATDYFEDIGHSTVARKKSRSLCISVDLACHGLCGVKRVNDSDSNMPTAHISPPMQRKVKQQRRRPATLELVEAALDERKEEFLKKRIHHRRKRQALGGHVVPYYDAFDRQWKAWYTDTNTFEPVFYQ